MRLVSSTLFGLGLCAGIYFQVAPSQEKCFMEEVAANQVVLVKYKQFNNPGVPCMIVFKDKKKISVSSQPAKSELGVQAQAVYMTVSSGDIHVCVKCSGSRWSDGEPLKWELRIDVGGEYLTASDAANSQDVSSITSVLQDTLSRSRAVLVDNNFIRENEKKYSTAQIDANDTIVWMAFVGILVISLCALTTSVILRDYFKSEKIV
jgi:hypothetical protein